MIEIIVFRLNTCFGPLTYFWISFWSLNFKLSQFGPISISPFTKVVPSISFLSKNINFGLVSFHVGLSVDYMANIVSNIKRERLVKI